MLFSGIPFLYYFLPAFILCYFAVPKMFKNFVLMVFSLFFYGCGEPELLLLMTISILVGYVGGIVTHRVSNSKTLMKISLGVQSTILLGFLAYYKYVDFFIGSFNSVTGLSVPLLNVALPIGISFYTFQILSYCVDVYRGIPYQKNLINFAAYVCMFPQLIAGPIVRYTDVANELETRTHSLEKTYEGIRRFIAGLAKKVLLANQLSELTNVFRASDEKSLLFYWMYAVSFALFIYFDFSGYSDMAIGLGKIMGFNFPENFNYPYLSKNITEFWRRWHMTLGSWFRDYVYIPLGGNRVKMGRWILNIGVVWAFTGLWHGAAWNFVVWGLLYAVMLISEKLFLNKLLEKIPAVFSHIYAMLVVMIGFVLFNAESWAQCIGDIKGLFGFAGLPFVTADTLYNLASFGVVMVIGIVGSTPLFKMLCARIRENNAVKAFVKPVETVVMIFILLLCTAYLVDGSFNPFLYFRF